MLLLRKCPGITVAELSVELCISGMGVRRHLEALASVGLAERGACEERHGVGRPPTGWRLTARGMELLPRRYDTFAIQLLDDLSEHVGNDAIAAALRRRTDMLVAQYAGEMSGATTLEERVVVLARIRDEAGYVAECHDDGATMVLTENNCAVHRVAERYPSVCAMELALFREVLGPEVEVTRVAHTMSGDAVCAYRIRARAEHAEKEDANKECANKEGANKKGAARRVAVPSSAELVAAARQVAEALAPVAEATDQADAVPRQHLRLLARAGLNDLIDVPPSAVREIYEDLAGACGVTFFVWVQHHAPVRLLASSSNTGLQQRTLSELRSGQQLAGIAFAYLRRMGPPAVAARRVRGGILVDGDAPWVTSWGLADVFAVAARLDGDVVFFLLPGRATPSVRPSPPLALAAMNASCTVRLSFDGLFVPDDDVISVTPLEQWRLTDRLATAKPHPAVFGVIRTCCRLLGAPARRWTRSASSAARWPTPWPTTPAPTTPTWPGWWRPGRGATRSRCGRPERWWRRPAAGPCSAPTPRSGSCGRPRSSPSRPRARSCEPPPWTGFRPRRRRGADRPGVGRPTRRRRRRRRRTSGRRRRLGPCSSGPRPRGRAGTGTRTTTPPIPSGTAPRPGRQAAVGRHVPRHRAGG